MKKVTVNGTLVFCLFLILKAILCAEYSPMVVVRSGTELTEDPNAIKFFVLGENRGQRPVTVGLEMKKCCQNISARDTDCESMSLHSGLRQGFQPGDKINMTMFYTNRYLYGRQGDCWLRLRSKEESKGMSIVEVQIHFDTHLLLSPLQKLISILPGSNVKTTCGSPDEDPVRGCHPVNCLLKYSGFRSYFNKTLRRCQSSRCAHIIAEMGTKPDTVLSPISNRCKRTKGPAEFNKKMEHAQDIKEVGALSFTKYPIKIRCVNGHRNDSGELCVCEPAWSSKNFSAKDFNPEIHVYVKCDQAIDRTRPVHSISLIILLGMLILLGIVLCIYIPVGCRRKEKRRQISEMSSELANGSSSSSDSERSETSSARTSVHEVSPSRASPKGKMMEFSPLVQVEQSTRRVVSESNPQQHPPTVVEKRLSYPDNFQLKPRAKTPLSSSCSPSSECLPTGSNSLTSSTRSFPVEGRWSIPDTSDTTPSHCSHTSLTPLTHSVSAEMFSRPVTCYCCCDDDPKPLVRLRVHEPNKNMVVSLRKFTGSDTSLYLRFPGPSAECISEIATRRWKRELDSLMNSKSKNEGSCSSEASSTFTTLSEFWRENESNQRENNSKSSKPKQALWFQQLIDSIKQPE